MCCYQEMSPKGHCSGIGSPRNIFSTDLTFKLLIDADVDSPTCC